MQRLKEEYRKKIESDWQVYSEMAKKIGCYPLTVKRWARESSEKLLSINVLQIISDILGIQREDLTEDESK